MDFLDSLIAWFDELGDAINGIISDVDYLLESFIAFMEFASMYVFISGAILLFIVLYLFALGARTKRTERKIDMLLEKSDVKIKYDAFVHCEQCGKMIEPDAEKPFCPYCGTYNNGNKKIG